MLNIPSCVLCSFELERFAADQGNRFRFHFAEVHGRGLKVHQFLLRGVLQNTVSNFMKRRLVRNCRDWADGNFSTCGKALYVAVHFVKRSPQYDDTGVFEFLETARELVAIPASQLAAMKLIVNQAYENMGLAGTQTLGPILDGLMRNTPDARRFVETAARDGVAAATAERDAPFGDYSQAPEGEKPARDHVIEPTRPDPNG